MRDIVPSSAPAVAASYREAAGRNTRRWTVDPIQQIADLTVIVTQPVDEDLPRVEIVDRRQGVEVVSLQPGDAAALALVLGRQAARAGWADPGWLAGTSPTGEPGA